jgi:hypothetical protein
MVAQAYQTRAPATTNKSAAAATKTSYSYAPLGQASSAQLHNQVTLGVPCE